jgi:ferritin-like metal-binding protein YciE
MALEDVLLDELRDMYSAENQLGRVHTNLSASTISAK